MSKYLIDLDDTIFFSEKIECKFCKRMEYKIIRVDEKEISLINDRHSKGDIIIIWTGRNWDCYDLTVRQLKKYGVKYNELIMGKPQGIIVDKDAIKTIEEAIC